MKRTAFGNRLTPVLLTACVLFGTILVFEWYALSREEGSTTGNKAQSADAADVQLTRTEFAAPDFEAFSEILERPLFTEGRTPPEQPTSEQTSVNPVKKTPLSLRLEGIALTPATRIAVVREIPGNKLLRLAEGAKHQGWEVESIHATGVTFKRGEQSHELLLELDNKSHRKAPRTSQKKRRKK